MQAEGDWGEGVAVPGLNPTAAAAAPLRHIRKRALKNKAISVGFNDKDLRDFVTGFHKRKKKRRKIAQKQLQEKERLKRIEARKKRKLEREFALYGGALQVEESSGDAAGAGDEDDGDDLEPFGLGKTQPVSGTKMYDNDDMTITVTTSELSREEDPRSKQYIPKPNGEAEKSGSLLPKKKPLKRVANLRSRKKNRKPASRSKGGRKSRKR